MSSSDRKSFLLAIEADPYDMEVRKVFADWLEECGDFDSDADLAVEQRAWTVEKQQAIDYLTDLAVDDLGITYEELIAVANQFLLTGEMGCFGTTTADRIYVDNDEIWDHLEKVLPKDRPISDSEKIVFFRCSC